jgi:hypothetical protein
VTQVNPDAYKTKEAEIRVTFGKLMPKDKKKDDKKKKKAAKKQASKKKDEKPKPPIKWAPEPKAPPATTLELMRDVAADLERDYP